MACSAYVRPAVGHRLRTAWCPAEAAYVRGEVVDARPARPGGGVPGRRGVGPGHPVVEGSPMVASASAVGSEGAAAARVAGPRPVACPGEGAGVDPVASAAGDASPEGGVRAGARRPSATGERRACRPASRSPAISARPAPPPASGGFPGRSLETLPDRRLLPRRSVNRTYVRCGNECGKKCAAGVVCHCPAVLLDGGFGAPVPRTYDFTRWFQPHARHTSTT